MDVLGWICWSEPKIRIGISNPKHRTRIRIQIQICIRHLLQVRFRAKKRFQICNTDRIYVFLCLPDSDLVVLVRIRICIFFWFFPIFLEIITYSTYRTVCTFTSVVKIEEWCLWKPVLRIGIRMLLCLLDPEVSKNLVADPQHLL